MIEFICNNPALVAATYQFRVVPPRGESFNAVLEVRADETEPWQKANEIFDDKDLVEALLWHIWDG